MKKLLFLALLCASPAFAQHSVTLTWTASADAAANPSLTYNVYRATSACPVSGVPAGATKINTTPIAALTFTDSPVQVGTNCYYATAVVNGAESNPSNAALARILPAPPTGFNISSAN